MIILEAINIFKSYPQINGELEILKGVDLRINAGEMVSIVGPSGAGKSTLLHILGGLDTPREGRVFLDNQDIFELNDEARAKLRNEHIGFIFQFYHLLPEFTALENVMLPVIIKEKNKDIKKLEKMGTALLERVGLKARMSHQPHQLSGGEQQRVAIARALINQPKMILCDEPTGNLDSQTGKEIIELLAEINKENKQTLVIVTHDEGIAKRSDRTFQMRDGKFV